MVNKEYRIYTITQKYEDELFMHDEESGGRIGSFPTMYKVLEFLTIMKVTLLDYQETEI